MGSFFSNVKKTDNVISNQPLDTLNKDINDLQQQLETLGKDKRSLEQQLETLGKDKRSLEQQLETLGKDDNDLKQQLETLRKDDKDLEQQLEDMTKTHTSLGNLLKALQNLKQEQLTQHLKLYKYQVDTTTYLDDTNRTDLQTILDQLINNDNLKPSDLEEVLLKLYDLLSTKMDELRRPSSQSHDFQRLRELLQDNTDIHYLLGYFNDNNAGEMNNWVSILKNKTDNLKNDQQDPNLSKLDELLEQQLNPSSIKNNFDEKLIDEQKVNDLADIDIINFMRYLPLFQIFWQLRNEYIELKLISPEVNISRS
jgi:hypothetical protein